MHSTDLSETVTNDLDTTFEPVENVPIPDDENTNDHTTSESEPAKENHTSLDDSVTLLKQAVHDEFNNSEQPSTDKNEQKRLAKNTKCSETCKVKPTTKRKSLHPMVSRNLCGNNGWWASRNMALSNMQRRSNVHQTKYQQHEEQNKWRRSAQKTFWKLLGIFLQNLKTVWNV